jgi:general secretion pathway protein J
MRIVAAKPLKRQTAFTLIEVLLAVAIFAVVLAAMNSVFYSALRLRNRTVATLDQRLPLQQAISIIRSDLLGLMAPGGTLSGELKATAQSSSRSSTAVTDLPQFHTTTGPIDETSPWSEVQKVSYTLVAPTNQTHGLELFRLATRNLLPSVEELPTGQFLVGGIEQILFYFYDGTTWKDTWDSTTEEAKLPKAIKVQIALALENGGQNREAPIEFVVPMTVQARTNATETASGGGT